ncbi:MAG: ParB/Srx family N-terminal domain-containing protein [Xanthobacteraceae bacterium]
MGAGKLTLLPVDDVELDRTNPRIRRFLENYEGEPTYEQIALALDVAGGTDSADGQGGAPTPEKLKNSILTNGGIMQPIIVNKLSGGKLVCIEGNTRLYIYRSFVKDKIAGDWTKIPALVHDGLNAVDVDAIRLQAHLVGPRQWDAYSKAKYLWELQYKEMMPPDRIVAFCGGNRREVTTSIQAYSDMENYYREVCEELDNDFDPERYSGFVELQNTKVKDAILQAGFTIKDFAKWIVKGNIKNLEQVRRLPRILPDKKAREVFIKKDVKAALDVLEKPELSGTLKGATISQLSRALTEAIDKVQYSEVVRLRANPDDDAVRYINDALEALQGFVKDLNAGT